MKEANHQHTRILLVDDEYLALNLLEEFLNQIPGTSVVAKCKTALDAMRILREEEVDVMFLDIQMPTLSGVDFLKGLSNPPAAIFTTAYRDYAVEAFELQAVDYLVKPFSFARFNQALERARDALAKAISEGQEESYIHLKVDGSLVRLQVSEIIYVEGMKEYIRVVTEEKKYVTFERLKNMEKLLPASAFTRVHKSYIVANAAVRSIEGNLLEVGIGKIPVSRSLRAAIVRDLFS
ncbi:MAG: LytTR family DNA-binding domain-containing protein [Bacteroidota bacterium]